MSHKIASKENSLNCYHTAKGPRSITGACVLDWDHTVPMLFFCFNQLVVSPIHIAAGELTCERSVAKLHKVAGPWRGTATHLPTTAHPSEPQRRRRVTSNVRVWHVYFKRPESCDLECAFPVSRPSSRFTQADFGGHKRTKRVKTLTE